MRSLVGDQTLFDGIRALMPGHLLSFAGGRATPRRLVDALATAHAFTRTSADGVGQFRALLEDSVR